MGYVFIFGMILLLLLVGFLVYKFSYLWGPIKPQEATPFQILLWTTVRDLEEEPEKTVDQVLDRIEETVGRSSGKMVEFQMNSVIKNQVKINLEKHLQNLENRQLTGSTFFAPQFLDWTENDPSLEKMSGRGSQGNPKSQPDEQTASLPEKNIKYLVKCWYVREMHRYNAAPDNEKPQLMREIVEDLYWWKQFYENVYYTCDLRPPTLINMLKELEMTFEYFQESSSEEEFREMVLFSEQLKAGFVTYEAKKQMNNLNKFLGPLFK